MRCTQMTASNADGCNSAALAERRMTSQEASAIARAVIVIALTWIYLLALDVGILVGQFIVLRALKDFLNLLPKQQFVKFKADRFLANLLVREARLAAGVPCGARFCRSITPSFPPQGPGSAVPVSVPNAEMEPRTKLVVRVH